MIYVPKICPIRIAQIAVGNNISQDLGEEFYEVDYVPACREWVAGVPLIFQFYSDTANPDTYVNGQALILTDITPTGWAGLGSYVYEAGYTPSYGEEMVFTIIENLQYFFESQTITVTDDPSSLIRIDYSNSSNDYGYIDGETLTTFIFGEMASVQPSNEIISYANDRGELTKLRSTPIEGYEIKSYYATYGVVNMLNMIFSCDTIEINQQPFQNTETISPERIENTNLFNVSIVVDRIDEDYEYFTTTSDGLSFIGDNTDLILSDNENSMVIL